MQVQAWHRIEDFLNGSSYGEITFNLEIIWSTSRVTTRSPKEEEIKRLLQDAVFTLEREAGLYGDTKLPICVSVRNDEGNGIVFSWNATFAEW